LREISRLDVFCPEAALREEGRNVPGDVTAFEQPSRQRLRALLPPPYSRFRRQAVFEEDEFAAGLEDSFDTAQRFHDTGNGAEREGAHDGIDRIIRQGDAFAREAQELDVEARPAPLPLGQSNHLPIRFERIDLAHLRGIVVSEVDAGTDADFQDSPFGPAEDALTDRTDGRGITERLYDPGVDVIAVERHAVILPHADARRAASSRGRGEEALTSIFK
jgi:hypothetical protein